MSPFTGPASRRGFLCSPSEQRRIAMYIKEKYMQKSNRTLQYLNRYNNLFLKYIETS